MQMRVLSSINNITAIFYDRNYLTNHYEPGGPTQRQQTICRLHPLPSLGFLKAQDMFLTLPYLLSYPLTVFIRFSNGCRRTKH